MRGAHRGVGLSNDKSDVSHAFEKCLPTHGVKLSLEILSMILD